MTTPLLVLSTGGTGRGSSSEQALRTAWHRVVQQAGTTRVLARSGAL